MMATTKFGTRSPLQGVLGAVLGLAAGAGMAQGIAPSGPGGAADPNPYYIGISQGFTHDSNVFRTPSPRGDTYSSTSLLGGFDQPIGRQRVFGRASVSANRYMDQSQLDNTSYNVGAGLDWSTAGKLSGSLNVGLGQSLAAPTVSGVVPVSNRNLSQTENVDARVRYGGASLLTLEGGLGYSKVDYSDPIYAPSETRQTSESLTLYYRPGAVLRLGAGVRTTQTDTPKALELQPGSGVFESNEVRGQNLDLLADYQLSGLLDASGRLSYTRQTNQNTRFNNADFSGLTGSLNLAYRPAGKLSFNMFAARDAGVNSSVFNGTTVQLIGTTPVLRQETGLYQNNQVTTSVGLGVGYAATAKVTANAGLRYARAKLVTSFVTATNNQASPDTTDVSKIVYLGADWAIARNWGAGCSLSHEARDVSGATNYAYTANVVGCSAQYTWR